MASVNLDEIKSPLPEIISSLSPGEELIILQEGEPVATLSRISGKQWPATAGSAKDTKHWMAPDFDAPLEDFGAYMQ